MNKNPCKIPLRLLHAITSVIFASICFAQPQPGYNSGQNTSHKDHTYNSPYGFTVQIPSGWTQVPQDIVDEYLSIVRSKDSKSPVIFDSAFKLDSANEPFEFPYILIQVIPCDRQIGEEDFPKFVETLTGLKTAELVEDMSADIRPIVKDVNIKTANLDRSKHRYFYSANSALNGVGEVAIHAAGHFGSKSVVQIIIYGNGSVAAKDESAWGSMWDSFQFDSMTAYKASESPGELAINTNQQTVQALLTVLALLFIALPLLFHSFTKKPNQKYVIERNELSIKKSGNSDSGEPQHSKQSCDTNIDARNSDRFWYYFDTDIEVGPVRRKELDQLLASGKITAQTLVWTLGLSAYTAAGKIENFVPDEFLPPSPLVKEFQIHQVRPWIRFWARMFDVYSSTFLLELLVTFFYQPPTFIVRYTVGLILFACYFLVIEPIYFSVFGTTPGKALLSIDLRMKDGKHPSFHMIFRRSIAVWTSGFAFGLPIIYLITLWQSHEKLTDDKITTWDKELGFQVFHRPLGAFKGLVFTVFVVGMAIVAIVAERVHS